MTTILKNAHGVRITEEDKRHGHHLAVGAFCQREECIAESRAVARLLRFCVHFCVHPHHPACGYSASPIGATG